MDFAYDHIAEQSFPSDRSQTPKPSADITDSKDAEPSTPNLQTEFQETFKAFSSSAWGTRLGGIWGSVRKQGESYYEEARKEAEDLGADALKWSEGLREKVVNASTNVGASTGRDRSGTLKAVTSEPTAAEDESKEDETLQENDTFIERFKTEAAKRLKEVQKAEDAADEALLRFGTNIRNFLRDAVLATAPEAAQGNNASEILFESKDATTGKRVIHTSRFDAQLHVIHTTLTSFTQDPEADEQEWQKWKQEFNVEQKTDMIAKDLERYPELRTAMEKLVPEKVEYQDFWRRYYLLRHVVEMQEEKRRELLKASARGDEEEVAWDDDSGEETDAGQPSKSNVVDSHTNSSSTTIQQPAAPDNHLKPAEARRSHDEKSVADSDTSYDLVSAAASAAPGSPKEGKNKFEESDEEDWE